MKATAHTLVSLAVRRGELIKPECCEDCGSTEKLIGHHPDYSKPLEVKWICLTCHGKRHAGEKRGPIEIGPLPEDFDQFLNDAPGYTKDLMYLSLLNIHKNVIHEALPKLGIAPNTLRQYCYREKSNQHIYLWRAILLSVILKNTVILEKWAQLMNCELHPSGTGKELARLRKLEADMKAVLGEDK